MMSLTIGISKCILSAAFSIGITLNGATVIIFLQRKKLRHLVNYLLLLDSISHLLVAFLAIPAYFIKTEHEFIAPGYWVDFLSRFGNMNGITLTLSIAILRYRRLCWKKKDILTIWTGLKWTMANGVVTVGITMAQTSNEYENNSVHNLQLSLLIFATKIGICSTSVFLAMLCYVGICRKVLHNPTTEKRSAKSQNLRFKASMHSAVQIILLISTILPHIYIEYWKQRETSASNQTIVFATTVNYTLLLTGTPLAYIASCRRYREQFIILLFSNLRRKFCHRVTCQPQKQNFQPSQLHLLSVTNKNGDGHRLVVRKSSPLNTTPLSINLYPSRKDLRRSAISGFSKSAAVIFSTIGNCNENSSFQIYKLAQSVPFKGMK